MLNVSNTFYIDSSNWEWVPFFVLVDKDSAFSVLHVVVVLVTNDNGEITGSGFPLSPTVTDCDWHHVLLHLFTIEIILVCLQSFSCE